MPPKGSKVKASPNKGKVVAKPAKKPAAKTKTAAPKRVPTKRGQTSYSKHCEKKVLETVNEHYKCKEKKLPLQLQAAVAAWQYEFLSTAEKKQWFAPQWGS